MKLFNCLIFIVFLTQSSLVYAQVDDGERYNQRDSIGNKVGKWMFDKDSIPVFKMKTSGFVIAEYKNDKLHGEYVVYDREETIRARILYVNGKREGLGYTYLEDGSLHEMVSFSNDAYLSRVFFDEKQRLYRVYEYNFNGEQHGKEVHFYKNGDTLLLKQWNDGVLRQEINYYKKNRPSSVYNYDQSGRLTETLLFKRNGKLNKKID